MFLHPLLDCVHTKLQTNPKNPEMENHHRNNILIVTNSAHGHFNPALHLANRLAETSTITLSTTISGHRRMFPSSPFSKVQDGLITYIPFSDGYDEGYNPASVSLPDYFSKAKLTGSNSLTEIINSLAEIGRPVTLIIYGLLLPWVCEVARTFDIPCCLYWTQPATVLAIYYHYFYGFKDVITNNSHDPNFVVSLPGLQSLTIRDLPSFLTITSSEHRYMALLAVFEHNFELLRARRESEPAVVLVNTFDELESDALDAVKEVRLVAVGPAVGFEEVKSGSTSRVDWFQESDSCEKISYMEWLDTMSEKSVVYVSFGSLMMVSRRQMEELAVGLKESGRPCFWVVRKNNREEGVELMLEEFSQGNCLVVEWCSQFQVLSHPSVGCFVSHCGWNSTLDSLTNGVPMVAVPQRSDQATNAWLVKRLGLGVRGELNEGVLEATEIKRCIDMIMDKGDEGVDIRRNLTTWSDIARKTTIKDGQSYKNLWNLVDQISKQY